MDSSRNKTPCRNSTYGCTFATSSMVDMLRHFQCDCTFHPVRCFKCNKMVRNTELAKHYVQLCEDSSAPACPAPEEAPDVNEAKAIATTVSQEEHFLRECVKECTSGMESLSRVMNHVAEDVKEMKEKQQDLEATVKLQGDWIKKPGKNITTNAEEQHFLQECVRECTLGVESLGHLMKNVAGDVAEVKVIKEKQQDLEATVKGQGDVIEKLGKSITMVAEKVNKLEQGMGSIVQGIEKVGGLVEDVLKRGIAYQSKVHWYVENVSEYIEKANTERSYAESEVFVVRGYSAKWWLEVEKGETGLCIGLFLCLCRGPNDSLLQWPFRIPYTLSLAHPKDASKAKEYKVTPPGAFPHCFEKPKNEENTGYGRRNLCTVEAAQNEGFVENDALCFALTLHE